MMHAWQDKLPNICKHGGDKLECNQIISQMHAWIPFPLDDLSDG